MLSPLPRVRSEGVNHRQSLIYLWHYYHFFAVLFTNDWNDGKPHKRAACLRKAIHTFSNLCDFDLNDSPINQSQWGFGRRPFFILMYRFHNSIAQQMARVWTRKMTFPSCLRISQLVWVPRFHNTLGISQKVDPRRVVLPNLVWSITYSGIMSS